MEVLRLILFVLSISVSQSQEPSSTIPGATATTSRTAKPVLAQSTSSNSPDRDQAYKRAARSILAATIAIPNILLIILITVGIICAALILHRWRRRKRPLLKNVEAAPEINELGQPDFTLEDTQPSLRVTEVQPEGGSKGLLSGQGSYQSRGELLEIQDFVSVVGTSFLESTEGDVSGEEQRTVFVEMMQPAMTSSFSSQLPERAGFKSVDECVGTVDVQVDQELVRRKGSEMRTVFVEAMPPGLSFSSSRLPERDDLVDECVGTVGGVLADQEVAGMKQQKTTFLSDTSTEKRAEHEAATTRRKSQLKTDPDAPADAQEDVLHIVVNLKLPTEEHAQAFGLEEDAEEDTLEVEPTAKAERRRGRRKPFQITTFTELPFELETEDAELHTLKHTRSEPTRRLSSLRHATAGNKYLKKEASTREIPRRIHSAEPSSTHLEIDVPVDSDEDTGGGRRKLKVKRKHSTTSTSQLQGTSVAVNQPGKTGKKLSIVLSMSPTKLLEENKEHT